MVAEDRRRAAGSRHLKGSPHESVKRGHHTQRLDNRTAQHRVSEAVKTSRAVVWLSATIAALALLAASVGLLWQDGGNSYSFTTLRGQTVEIYGRGLYRYDSLFAGAGNRGTDAVTVFLGIPLLVVATLLYRRGSLRGGLLLTGALTWFLYAYASYALGTVAYNELFLLYVALFSASLFAFVLAFASFDARALRSHFSSRMPRHGPAIFMFASGLLTLLVWLIDPLGALIRGEPPETLAANTTLFTNALDIAIIVPATFLAGARILRRDPTGYLIAAPLLVLEAMLAPMIAAQTVSQVRAGVSFTPAEMVGPIAGFALLGLVATWVLIAILRNVSE